MIPSADSARISRRRLCGLGLATFAAAAIGLGSGCSSGDDSAGDDAGRAPDSSTGSASGKPVMYSSPSCGCCGDYADYLRSNGHDVNVEHLDDLTDIKADAGIPEDAQGCHTTMMDDYVIEGHVPIEAIDKLLNERPDIDGIALPGMPNGSPGMDGSKDTPFEIMSLKDGSTGSYMTL